MHTRELKAHGFSTHQAALEAHQLILSKSAMVGWSNTRTEIGLNEVGQQRLTHTKKNNKKTAIVEIMLVSISPHR